MLYRYGFTVYAGNEGYPCCFISILSRSAMLEREAVCLSVRLRW